ERRPGARGGAAAGGLPPRPSAALPRGPAVRGGRRAHGAVGGGGPQAVGPGRRAPQRGPGEPAMSEPEQPAPDQPFPALLAGWDEALASGAVPSGTDPAALTPQLRRRLEEALPWVQLLQQLRPSFPSTFRGAAPPGGGSTFTQGEVEAGAAPQS